MVFGIRQPKVAGSFYPDNKEDLILMLKKLFEPTRKLIKNQRTKALIVPHAGYIYSGQTAAWGYAQLGRQIKTPKFVLIGPSHGFLFDGLACSDSGFWLTHLGKVKHLPLLKDAKDFIRDDRPHLEEHSLEVQLPFLQYLYQNFSLSCFLTSGKVRLEKVARYFLQNYPRAIFITSSDLSHFLTEGEARKKDRKTIEAILRLDFNYFYRGENLACGALGITILMTMAKITGWQRKLVYYDTSFTASRKKDRVVSYASIAFYQ